MPGIRNAARRQRGLELLQVLCAEAAHGGELRDHWCAHELSVERLGCQEAPQRHVPISRAALAYTTNSHVDVNFGHQHAAAVEARV